VGELPRPVPQGRYVPAVVHAGVVHVAGMTPRVDGVLAHTGRVGVDVPAGAARDAAGIAARNALGAVEAVLGDLGRVQRCLRLTVYVACADDFTDLSVVADGASAALTEVLGARGAAVRSAVGVRTLPGGAPVEVELTAAVAADDAPG
jgi:enamine deaminase RidA (YjgF/YER057c/UK114 family)